MRRILLALPVLALAACGGTDTQTPEDAAPEFTTVEDIRDQLAGTEYECTRWRSDSPTIATCGIGDRGNQTVQITGDGELLAAGLLDAYPDVPGVVWGDGWTVKCHEWLGADGCGGVADTLGGTVATH